MENVVIGINGLGRMGKLVLWQLIATDHEQVVVNLGREAGEIRNDLMEYILYDSTYGSLRDSLFGRFSHDPLEVSIDEDGKYAKIHKTGIVFLKKERNPKNIPWNEYGASVVIETTGQFNYPERPVDYSTKDCDGSVRGHFASSSVRKVLISSPLKGAETEGAVMIVMGINEHHYKPKDHWIISNASCSTNCLSHVVYPWVKCFGPDSVKNMIVDIPHAETGKTPSLDRLPRAGKSDPCTYRSAAENMFISSTGSARALPAVINGLEEAEFSAESIREPSQTVSLVHAVLNLEVPYLVGDSHIRGIYAKFGNPHLTWSDKQNFSGKFIGSSWGAIIEGRSCKVLPLYQIDQRRILMTPNLYGWFDNEWGYVSKLMCNLGMILETL